MGEYVVTTIWRTNHILYSKNESNLQYERMEKEKVKQTLQTLPFVDRPVQILNMALKAALKGCTAIIRNTILDAIAQFLFK